MSLPSLTPIQWLLIYLITGTVLVSHVMLHTFRHPPKNGHFKRSVEGMLRERKPRTRYRSRRRGARRL